MGRVLVVAIAVTGIASRYDPGVFQSVVQVRQRSGSLPSQLPDYDGAHIALLDCSDIGKQVLVCKGDDCRFALVADCAGVTDGGRAWMIRNGIAGEIDDVTAERLNAVGQEIQIYTDASLAGVVPGRDVDVSRGP